MENKINVAELLRDCPEGMELDCTICEDVYFDYVSEFNKIHCYIQYETYRTSITFNQYGAINSDIKSKCVIFPKGKTTWEGFVPPCQFKDGDVLFVDCSDDEDKSYQYIFISNDPKKYGKWHSYCHLGGTGHFYSRKTYLTDDEYNPRFATEEEKAKLFQAIKDNGYKWNAETKTLERLIQPKFDINTLVSFESRVLVRDYDIQIWIPTFWGKYLKDSSNCSYLTTNGCYKYCIPYEGNEHLLGTTNACSEFYRTWEQL